jgi:RNA polymerase subunit RPABC4/transcription elongation factor Spt4
MSGKHQRLTGPTPCRGLRPTSADGAGSAKGNRWRLWVIGSSAGLLLIAALVAGDGFVVFAYKEKYCPDCGEVACETRWLGLAVSTEPRNSYCFRLMQKHLNVECRHRWRLTGHGFGQNLYGRTIRQSDGYNVDADLEMGSLFKELDKDERAEDLKLALRVIAKIGEPNSDTQARLYRFLNYEYSEEWGDLPKDGSGTDSLTRYVRSWAYKLQISPASDTETGAGMQETSNGRQP